MEHKIYLIENIESGKKYVGWTSKTLKKRFKQHSYSKRAIGNAIRKHGMNKFTIKQLEVLTTRDEALCAEIKWVAHYNSNDKSVGYNCTKGGDDSPKQRNNEVYKTEEFSKRMSEQATNQHNNAKTKKHHVDGIRSYWDNLSEEEMKIRREIAKKNGKLTKGWNKGMKCPRPRGENNPSAKKYLITHPDGTTEIIKSLKTYCEANGLTYRNAQGVLEGKQKHHKGYRFTRLEN